jgi:NAD-reducing hydrogenase small subunit
MSKTRLAMVWLDGCSGCHMSFLDIDERILELAGTVDLVFSPLVDVKEFPEQVDVTLVEGAVASEEDREKLKRIRSRTRTLVSLGDCAVTANVPSMRNAFPLEAVLERAYGADAGRFRTVPTLLQRVGPVHEVVDVDVFVPGCPPSPDAIWFLLTELVAGRRPDMSKVTRFGA